MPTSKQVVCKLRSYPFRYAGGGTMVASAVIWEGPTNLLDRKVQVQLSFDEIEALWKMYQESKKVHEREQARLTKHTADNCSDE